jgi:TonB-linked SusC/RagA family outer membrane protein
MKKYCNDAGSYFKKITSSKIFELMRNTFFLILITVFQAYAADTYSQNTKLSLNLSNVTVANVLEEIQNGSEFYFLFNSKLIDVNREVTISVKNSKISEILKSLFLGTGVNWVVYDKQIILTPSNAAAISDAFQQQQKVTGTVVDKDGKSLAGVSVVVTGTTQGTTTDIAGNYSIDIPKGSKSLKFTFVGMNPQEIPIGTLTQINVTLLESAIGLEEVVVVGYGTQKKVNLTGAISTVDNKSLTAQPVANVQQALQGLVPNLNISVSNSGGEPGATMDMNIRGLQSFSGTASPYILVDGIPMAINDVDPNDIDNISVLKDAASSAIYGARAAYGVILITTKSGKYSKTGGITVNYSNNFALAQPLNFPKMVGTLDFAYAMNDAAINQGSAPWYNDDALTRLKANIAKPGSAPVMFGKPDGLTWNIGAMGLGAADNTDWRSILFKNFAFRQRENLSISGGTEKINYYLSAGYYNEQGLLKYGDEYYNQYNFDGKVSAKATSWLSIEVYTKYKKNESDFPWQKDLGRGRIYDMWTKLKPTMPAKYPGTDVWTLESRIAEWQAQRQHDVGNQLNISPRFIITPLKGWVTNMELNYQINSAYETFMAKQTYWVAPNGNLMPEYAQSATSYLPAINTNQYMSPTVYSTYTRTFGKHNLTAMAGYQNEQYKYFNMAAQAYYLLSDNVPSVSTAVGTKTVSDGIGHWSTESYFGRLNYNYDERLFLEANIRRDGSSRFKPGRQWGSFPSVSAGWVISKENFFPLKELINFLKIRGSYGSLGNQNVANYLYIPTLTASLSGWLFNDSQLWTVSPPNLTSINLTWEKVSTADVGIDVSLLKNHLSATFDWYQALTTNLVGPGQALPVVLGTGVPAENGGEVRTRGWELQISWKQSQGDFYYELTGILSDNHSVVMKYNNPNDILTTYYSGERLGEIWGFKLNGLFQSPAEVANYGINQNFIWSAQWNPGDPKYIDLNGDGKIDIGTNTKGNSGDQTVIGNSSPRYLYGFNARAAWKGFDLGLQIQGVGKKDLYLTVMNNGSVFRGPAQGPMHACVFEGQLDYWRDDTSPLGANPNAYYPKPYSVFTGANNKAYGYPTDRYLQNGAFMRLKNVQLGYTIPAIITNKVKIANLKIYMSAENLLTFTRLRVLDPEEINGANGGGKIYPLSKTYSMGLNVTF